MISASAATTIVMWRRLFLLFLCLCGWASCAFAVLPDVAAQPIPQRASLDRIQVFEDVSGRMRLDDVLAMPTERPGGFRSVRQDGLKPGFSHSAWWLRVTVTNRGMTESSLVLALMEPRLVHVDFHIGRDGHRTPDSIDSTAAPAARPSVSRNPLTRFTLGPGEQAVILIRVAGDTALALEPKLYAAAEYEALEKRAALWGGGLIGGVLALGWCALLIACFSRSVSFLVLAAVCFMTASYEAALRGYTKVYLWPHAVEWSARSVSVFGCVSVLLFIVFILRIAHGERTMLPARRVLSGFAVLECVTAAGAAFGNLYVFAQVSLAVNGVFGIVEVGVAAVLSRQATPTARIMLITVGFGLFNFALHLVETLGFLPAGLAWLNADIRPNPVIAVIGLATHLVVLAAWINHVGKQRQEAREELADWQRSEHERLRHEVAQRTAALNAALLDAEEKNQQKIETLGYVSHDLRAPLATIAGYAGLLLDAADSKQAHLIRAIERSVSYQLGLIDELIGYAKAELQPLDIAPAPTDLLALLNDIAEYAIALCTPLNNQFHHQALTSLPRRVAIDGRRLQQVLLNLLSNASKFTRDGIVMMTVRARRQDDRWLIGFDVADTGIGIGIEQQSSLFSAFRQMQSMNGTTGLGLFIAQRIVATMGGDLRVSSAPARGTSFSFEIVVDAAEAGAAATSNVIPYSSFGSADIHVRRDRHTAIAVPPESDRRELAVLAKDGRLTDIEQWIDSASRVHPAATAFLAEIRLSLDALDFSGIEALALAPHDHPVH
ncbi:sensor histidine kinase [Burkholderia ubonensis]|uniref:sensor histidine kinase n=1 Tax=Burkholderia ubonensis TaxID=101571 RepID=UPI0022B75DAC|nr:sensor histidine kinase [Burkholderia ubonensis]